VHQRHLPIVSFGAFACHIWDKLTFTSDKSYEIAERQVFSAIFLPDHLNGDDKTRRRTQASGGCNISCRAETFTRVGDRLTSSGAQSLEWQKDFIGGVLSG
jgi:hypothetical protein